MSRRRELDENGHLTCPRCRVPKPLSLFIQCNGKHLGVGNWCKQCFAFYYSTPEHRAASRLRNAKYRSRDPRKPMLCSARKRAKEKGLPFDLVIDDFQIPDVCPIFGVKLQIGTKKYTDNSPSLDRFYPARGYVKGNVWVISRRANTIKGDASVEELERIVQAMRAR